MLDNKEEKKSTGRSLIGWLLYLLVIIGLAYLIVTFIGQRTDVYKRQLCNCGITVVVSAGNYGLQSRKVSVPGTNEKVLTVGAYRRSGMGRYCSGTGRERICVWKPDIFAPGEGIVSCGYEAVNGESCFQRKEFFPYIRKSGASMATPVVTGALALAKSKYPELEGEELKRYLLKRCGRSLRVEQLLA